MAATAVGLDLDIEMETIIKALEDYSGTGRRFELKKVVKDIMIIEDYAHHPTEIKATLQAARTGWQRRLVVVFQPHRYSRLARLKTEFVTAFHQADLLILTEIYPAGEIPIPGVNGQSLFEDIQRAGQTNVCSSQSWHACRRSWLKNYSPVICCSFWVPVMSTGSFRKS